MNWEMPDRNWFKIITPSLAGGFIGLVLLANFFSGQGVGAPTYETECMEQGGEWLLNAEKPTCVFPGGRLVYFGDGQDGSLTPPPSEGGGRGEVSSREPNAAPGVVAGTSSAVPAGTVIPSDDWLAAATDKAPECEIGQAGEFVDYPVTDIFKGRPDKPDFLTMPEAAQYRTAITKDVARGVNFAGAYVISTWGKPEKFNETKTIGYAVVDARDGRILEYGPNDVLAIDFQKNSRFFRVHTSVGPVAQLVFDGQVLQCGRY